MNGYGRHFAKPAGDTQLAGLKKGPRASVLATPQISQVPQVVGSIPGVGVEEFAALGNHRLGWRCVV